LNYHFDIYDVHAYMYINRNKLYRYIILNKIINKLIFFVIFLVFVFKMMIKNIQIFGFNFYLLLLPFL